MIDHFRVGDEEPEADQIDDTGREDAELAEIEALFNERAEALGDAYPFELSDSGAEICYLPDEVGDPAQAYMMCLFVSANRRLPGGWHSDLNDLKVRLTQRIIQLVATVAMAGLARGPAVSVGWPRQHDGTILEILARAAGMGSCVIPRNEPNTRVARTGDKDAGIDILAWENVVAPQTTPGHIYLGQVASGNRWRDKSVWNDKGTFQEGYVDSAGTRNWNGATIIPFVRRDPDDRTREDYHHGKVLDRHSLPRYFAVGIALSEEGIPMDEIENIAELTRWNSDMISELS
ncbi:hypothetical protein [Roseivivax marinus]|uniref:hypothetical protein n=1 Tax=Roseivivax marinus TaxID=1379903 RepID=UPI00103E0FB9|nr:hypothetical protein [Roseivivax marinus]